MKTTLFSETLQRKLLFVHGKGGVGKTAVARALATLFSKQEKSTLYVTFDDPTRAPGELKRVNSSLSELNAAAGVSFEEYIDLKLGGGALTRLFTHNKLIQYLAEAAPGMKELVLLGKIWHEAKQHDRVIVDMPSTGHAVAMFQSTENFARLFTGGPIQKDASAMLDTFHDPNFTGHLVVALPEEMPLIEALELNSLLGRFFPENPCGFVLNKRFPRVSSDLPPPDEWKSPVAASATDYVRRRSILEQENVKIWEEKGIQYLELPFLSPPEPGKPDFTSEALCTEMRQRQ